MKRQLTIIKLLLSIWTQDLLVYRTNVFLSTIKYGWYVFMMAFVWLAVQAQNPDFIYSRSELITYYILAAVFFGFSNHWLDHVELDIKEGQISKFLVKPIPVFSVYFLQAVMKTLVESVLKILMMLSIAWALGFVIKISLPGIFPTTLILALVHVFSFSLLYTLTLLSFWFQEVYSVRYTTSFVARFLSGLIVPVAIFPPVVQKTLAWLPFKEYAATPIGLLLGEITPWESVPRIGVLLCWIAFMTLCMNAVWHRATHSYESTGI